MANKDLVVKLTINSDNFDSGLKNAKASMNRFNSDAKGWGASFKSVVGTMTKAFGALGIAVGATDMFKSFINSTQTMSDKWGNAMMTAKTSFQVFVSAVANGTGTILSNFRESINAAREFAEAMDAFESAQISNQYARMEYVTPFQEAMTRYREAKAAGDNTKMAFAASDMQRNLEAYRYNAETLMQTAMDVVTAKLSAYTGGFVNRGNVGRYLDQLYLEIVNGVLPPILKDFKNLEVERKKGDYFYNQAKEAMVERYGNGWRRDAEALDALAEINDDTLKEMLGVLKTYDQVRNDINSMRRQMNRVVNGEATTPTTTTSTPAPAARPQLELVPALAPISAARDDTAERIEKLRKKLEEMNTVTEETVLINTMMNMVWQNQIDKLNNYATAIGQFSNMFAELTNLAADGSPWQRFGAAISGVLGEISKLMSTYASLIAIESVAESIKAGNGIPFPYNLIAIAAAGTALLGIISSLKGSFKDAGSFATGGIVGGNSYTGDRLIAHVNSGEMILNRSQQMALFGRPSDNVHFIIEGSQLRGVLDNYDKTSNL